MRNDLAITARRVSYSFGGHEALTDVTTSIPWGALTVITGANGAGKSTLLEILAGVRRPGSGSVHRSDEVALVVQRTRASHLLPLTVGDVVDMGLWGRTSPRRSREDRRVATRAALEQLGLHALAGRPFAELSGGQRQRVLLAQAMVRGCDILLLDEPATGLDSLSRQQIQSLLEHHAARGAAVVQVTHDPTSASRADHVIHLADGRVSPGNELGLASA
ncbi:zinc ABC transporter ATP-binding protein AztA [Tessaracoccus terricola]